MEIEFFGGLLITWSKTVRKVPSGNCVLSRSILSRLTEKFSKKIMRQCPASSGGSGFVGECSHRGSMRQSTRLAKYL